MSSPSPRHTQAERREIAERAILDAATWIVAERGLEALTLHEVGEAAGYSRALPAHYFGTRANLLAALAAHILENFTGRIRDPYGEAPGLDMLLARIGFYIDEGVRDPEWLRAYLGILASGLTSPELSALVSRLNRDSIDGLAALIATARDMGEVRADVRPRAEASIIVAAMRGVMFQWLMDGDLVSIDTVRDRLLASIRTTLAP
jgi:AcrR family transcriptional regulator